MTRCRPIIAFAAFGLAALLLGGCQTKTAGGSKDQQPIPSKTLALMKDKGMTRRDPILVRIYKEDSQLEIWKQNEKGRYAHLKTYEICRWSGTLGPKKTEGDGQAPEGFYQVAAGQMNPKSQYYLSFNLGFPNAFDRNLGRTGSHLMVHGDCLSKGCYAMTDEQMAEVYAIAREALNGGQPSFQVQAFPFRMTAENLARRRNDSNFEFWQNLKEGADHFEVTKLEPKVGVCGSKYVFNGQPKDGVLDPNAGCSDHEVNPLIASAVTGKQRQDNEKFEQLVSGGFQVADAYTPQNGRVRRSLKDPIHPPGSQPSMMTAAAQPRAPQSDLALAMTSNGPTVPMPVPSPYASPEERPSRSGGGAFAWLRGGKPAEPASATTPEASAGSTSATAQARRAPEPGRPMVASLAPVPQEQPFYKRWLGFGEKPSAEPAPAAAPAQAPRAAAVSRTPTTAPAPVPAPRPAAAAPSAPAPAQAAAPQPVPAPPAPAPAPPAPSRADAAFQQFGGSQILNSGTFQ